MVLVTSRGIPGSRESVDREVGETGALITWLANRWRHRRNW